MSRTALYLKVEVDHDERERPERLAEEICRRLLKMPGVRSAQLSAAVAESQDDQAGRPPPTSSW